MFTQAIDQKKNIIDPNGNTIVDLTPSVFSRYARAIDAFDTVKMEEKYEIRPDMVSWAAYGTMMKADMILKYSGISNPFSLCKDDILMIPPESTIFALLATDIEEGNENEAIQKESIKNYYKFTSSYKADDESHNELEDLNIPSAVLSEKDDKKDYAVPYISTDGKTAITIRNGRMYFGEDCGLSVTEELDKKIQTLIDCTATAINDLCAINGLSLADFVRASTKNNL